MPKKKTPDLKSDKEVFEFWSDHDTTEYLDLSKAKRVKFPNLKRSTKSITMRLPQGLLDDVKIIANKYDVPYQAYIKMLIANAVQHEHHKPV